MRDVNLVTHICSHSAECLFATFCNQTWYIFTMHHHEPECHAKKWDSIFKAKVTVWAYIIKIRQFLLYLLLVLNQ